MSHPHIDWKPAFIAALRHMPVVRHACEAASIHRATAYKARETDEDFAKAWDEAMEEGIDRAEQAAFKRAVDGWEEPVIDKGRLAYAYRRVVDDEGKETFEPVIDANGQPVPLTVRKHSDGLLTFVLKGRRRGTYGDKTEVTGANGGPITTMDETAKAARLAALMAAAQARKDLA
jgi:hypothetical protein